MDDNPYRIALDEVNMVEYRDDTQRVFLRAMALLLNELDPRPESIDMAFGLAHALGNVVGVFSNLPPERFDEVVASLSKVIRDRAYATRDAQERHARGRAH
jgi:hypothetical protein